MTNPLIIRLSTLAFAASLAAPAFAELKYDNDSGGSTLLYGQFSPAYQSFDDGVTSEGTVVDNAHSNSRVGIWVRQPFGGSTFSFNFETALGLRPSNLVTQGFTPKGINWQRTSIRKIDFSLKTDSYGTFSAGQGSMATDGVVYSDYSGTELVTYGAIGDTAGAYRFRTTAGALTLKTIAGATPDFDGGRRGRVRYDTPEFGGFTVSAAYGKEVLVQNSNLESRDVALRYGGAFGDFRVKAALGYKRVETGPGVILKDTIGSIGIIHASGFNVSLAAGDRKNFGSYTYGKIGYQAQWLPVGTTSMAVDYYNGSDTTTAGSEAAVYGIGVVQKFDDLGIEAYLGYRSYELTETAATYLDASSVLFGARWKF